MDELRDTLMKLRIPTIEISSEIVQVVLVQTKRHNNCSKERGKEWNDIAELLWEHMKTGISKYDDQLLCATCFFSVLPLTDNQELYLGKIILIVRNELDIRQNNIGDLKNSSKISEVVSVMYGLFQSAFLTQKTMGDSTSVAKILKATFNLLLVLGYEYSRFTFLAFKTMNSFKKVLGTPFQEHIFNATNVVTLLNLVNNNWENPITGVRDLNRGIFQTIISNIDQDKYKVVFTEINGFYWNKAKYLMLSEVIEQYKTSVHVVVKKYDWVDGLMYSLHKPGLVSAGADMYYAILKTLKSDEEWCGLFLKDILKILTAKNCKAIENFTNYWCLTTYKKIPSLAQRLIAELELVDDTENKIYSSVCLLKQANKMGLLHKEWNAPSTFPKNLLLEAVESYNPSIRIQAFDVICVSHNKTMPEKLEYKIILSYLKDNVNSDCTVLRLSMLSSLNSFLTRLQSAYMTNSRSADMDAKELISFSKELQKFIVTSLNLNGNYQRKIATVKLCKLIQDCFCNLPRRMQRQGGRIKSLTVCEMLKEDSSWILGEKEFVMKLISLLNDPSDDIRENVVQLLLIHYSNKFKCPILLNHVIDDAITSMRSKFFYNISCGRSMFKLISNILLTEESSAKFKSVEDVFLFAYKELATEYKLKTDIVKSIENGKQLHSLITILHVVLEVCYENSYKILSLNEHFGELVMMLEEISNQFAWEDTSISSDFSKMSDMVENMIATSGYDHCDEIDQTKISGLHQIVLNCLWLNVKVSCDLASLLIQFSEDIQVIDKCLKIITRVLETCRHKGAIEAAGAAIGRAVQYLTSLPDGSAIQQLPYTLLTSKLKDLISEAGAMASITRRGAGLSIMVHRIVSSDMKRGKPLFHYFMETLLETCKSIDDSESEETIDNQKDLPQAIYIHFLTRIVTDSSLASDMMYYSAKLAELAFGNLISPRWQIRNAALQLYGALIPKLIGQKKASGSDEETVATVACDEFRTHSPALWTHIIQSLEACCTTSEVQAHSNLVPILNILGNIARRYSFSFNIERQKSDDGNLLISLILLLRSPLYTIRRLTAKCIYNIFAFEVIYNAVMKLEVRLENFLHGILILLSIYHKKCYSYQLLLDKNSNYKELKGKFDSIMKTGNHSYLCRQLYEDIFSEDILDVNALRSTLAETRKYTYSPGVSLWADRRIEKCVTNIPLEKLPDMLEIFIEHNWGHYGTIILKKLRADDIPKEILFKLTDQLLAYSQKNNSTIIWEILYEISMKVKLENVDVKIILKYLKENKVPYRLRFAIPFAARVAINKDDLCLLSENILSLSDPENNDTGMRFIAALANNEMVFDHEKLSDLVKINAIISAVILLQEEDENIRSISVQFYKNIQGGVLLNPYICLQNILNKDFLNSVLKKPKEGTILFCDKLSEIFAIKSSDTDQYNPFANESRNIYSEPHVMKQFIEKLRC